VSRIRVEVCYAGPEGQFILPLELAAGATLGEAVAASGLCERIPGLRVDDQHVGVFSRPCTLATTLREGDRVEIYRPLQLDPREARRERARRPRA
jgi:putative ubiquitin-RnfH superfamily antitoxin RatB of RatAB toxin-antitoxin module